MLLYPAGPASLQGTLLVHAKSQQEPSDPAPFPGWDFGPDKHNLILTKNRRAPDLISRNSHIPGECSQFSGKMQLVLKMFQHQSLASP